MSSTRRLARLLLLLPLLGLLACDLWPQDGPYDPTRCTPRCAGQKICREGQCVWPFDAGETDAGPDGG